MEVIFTNGHQNMNWFFGPLPIERGFGFVKNQAMFRLWPILIS